MAVPKTQVEKSITNKDILCDRHHIHRSLSRFRTRCRLYDALEHRTDVLDEVFRLVALERRQLELLLEARVRVYIIDRHRRNVRELLPSPL